MMGPFIIEQMSREEVNTAIEWAAKEQWNPGLNDAECFYQTDPHGFFAGKLDGQIIAVGSAVIYDEYFAFCGFYIVDKNYRSKGYGLELTRARLSYIGDRNAGLDGVINMQDKYAQIGYQFAHNNARYKLDKPLKAVRSDETLKSANTLNFAQLCAYDRLHFPALRPQFLKCWINQKNGLALACVQNNTVKGYGVIRACRSGYKIGPLFAETPEIAHQLFFNLAQYAQGNEVFLDIPENNPLAIDLVNEHKMNKIFATARMYLKNEPQLAAEHIYGITTFELG
ncbi:GNAT family N-acetyltransferase [Legionella bononiensis]|uniref:GNAT family N-acetyltransferase n=1 Tax=Legionella bononiensis TaxID=2793102 RepID=A0ABS1WCE8_9GAMM|nr:GNAT family N-acetyltransferase [Legionella bononiensis]MBL7526999.1 GNAT family N-acetyltransferase [Legionella bononiensis]MBL7562407.1 GNAT family N-acetyltransferase [Legionella bononiensis]